MPDPHDNAKMTGDTHPPDVESELPFEEESSPDVAGIGGAAGERGKSSEEGREGRPGRGVKKAGVLKDREAQPGKSHGTIRESGEDTSGGRG